MDRNVKVEWRRFYFGDHSVGTKQGGLLPDDIRAQACWYYVTCAHKNLDEVSEGAVYEGELDPLSALANILRSIALVYGISDPSEILKFMPYCRAEAERCHLEWNPKVENPQPSDQIPRISMPTIN